MTSLAKQLSLLARPQPALPSGTKASLLFDVKSAARIERDLIFSIGCNGLDELRQLDDSLVLWYSDLFEETYAEKHYTREVLTEGEVRELDGKVREAVDKVAGYFLFPACHKVLELLIRYYQVHIYARDFLLLALLPYHDTKVFVRLLQLVNLQGCEWEWLRNHQQVGAIVPRADLVTICGKDVKVLSRVLSTSDLSPVHLRFSAVLAAQTVGQVPTLTDNYLHALIPKLSLWLQSGREERAAAYLLITQIASRHPFSPDYLNAIWLEVVQTAGEDLLPACKLLIYLLKTHPNVTIPPASLDLLLDVPWVEAAVRLTDSSDTKAICSLLGRRAVGQISTKGKAAAALVSLLICADKLSPEALSAILTAILAQYVTQKKSREEHDFPLYCRLLALIGDRHAADLATLLPKAIIAIRDSHKGEKTKAKLNSLISHSLSGLPLDQGSDLPLYLSLQNPMAEVRLAAVQQLAPYMDCMQAAVLDLVLREENYDVLLGLLQLPVEGREMAVAVAQRLVVETEKKCQRRDVVEEMVALVLGTGQSEAEIVIPALVAAYSMPEMQEFVTSKAHSLVGGLFPEEAPAAFEVHIASYAVSQWNLAFPLLIPLLASVAIRKSLIIAYNELKSQANTEESIVNSLETLAKHISSAPLQDPTTISLLKAAFRACPRLSGSSPGLVALLSTCLPLDKAVSYSCLKRHFKSQTLEVLASLVPKVPAALEALTCIALQSGPNAVLQSLAVLLMALGADRSVRPVALASANAVLKGKCAEDVPRLELRSCEALEPWEGDLAPATGLLGRVMRHRAGLMNDGNYLAIVLGKVCGKADFALLVACLKSAPVARTALIKSLEAVKGDELTDLLIEAEELNREERLLVLQRLREYQGWREFRHMAWVAQLCAWKEAARQVLEVFTVPVFEVVSLDNQQTLITSLLHFLCLSHSGELSTDLHLRLSDYSLSTPLLHSLMQVSHTPEVLDKLLTLVLYAYHDPEPVILRDLFMLLKHLSEANSSDYVEHLKQMVLMGVKLHYPAVLQIPELEGKHIDLLVACVVDGNEATLQTKAYMYSALAGCCHMCPAAVASQLKASFSQSPMKYPRQELAIMKVAIEQVAVALAAQRISLTGVLLALVEGAKNPALEGELPKLLADLVGKIGAKYLCPALIHLFTMGLEAVPKTVLNLLPVTMALEALHKLLQLLPLLVIKQKSKSGRKEVCDVLEKLESEHMEPGDEVLILATVRMLYAHIEHLESASTVSQLADTIKDDSTAELFSRVLINAIASLTSLSSDLQRKKPDSPSVSKPCLKAVKRLIETVVELVDSRTFALVHAFALRQPDKEVSVDVKRGLLDLLLVKARMRPSKKYTKLVPALLAVLKTHSQGISALAKGKNQALAAYLDTVLIVLPVVIMEKQETSVNMEVVLPFASAPLHQIRSNSLLALSHWLRLPRPSLLPYLSPVLTQLISHLSTATEKEALDTGIKAAQEILEGMHEFITPVLDQLVLVACRTPTDTEDLIKALSRLCPIRLLITPIESAFQQVSGLGGSELTRLFALLSAAVRRLESAEAAVLSTTLTPLFVALLDFPMRQYKELGETHREMEQQVETLAAALGNYALNLTNAQFRPLLVRVCEWGVGKDEEESRVYRSFLYFSIIRTLSRSMKSFFTPYIKYPLDDLISALTAFTSLASHSSKKRPRDLSALSIATNTLALSCISSFCAHEKEGNFSETTYEQLSSAVLGQLGCIGLPEYSAYEKDHVVPSIVELFQSTKDETVWKAMNYKLLLQTRSGHSQVRRVSFDAISALAASLDQAFSALVSDVMPFIGEGLEDEHDEVTLAAKKALRSLEKVSGEDLKEYLR